MASEDGSAPVFGSSTSSGGIVDTRTAVGGGEYGVVVGLVVEGSGTPVVGGPVVGGADDVVEVVDGEDVDVLAGAVVVVAGLVDVVDVLALGTVEVELVDVEVVAGCEVVVVVVDGGTSVVVVVDVLVVVVVGGVCVLHRWAWEMSYCW